MDVPICNLFVDLHFFVKKFGEKNKAWLVDMKEREALVNDLKAINPTIEVKNG
jgi:hypothetical protein